uniref:Uncharacterized protein n=1 Tax=Rhodnius prolixus TaxID=13249 RepID=T1HGI9_RHOPR
MGLPKIGCINFKSDVPINPKSKSANIVILPTGHGSGSVANAQGSSAPPVATSHQIITQQVSVKWGVSHRAQNYKYKEVQEPYLVKFIATSNHIRKALISGLPPPENRKKLRAKFQYSEDQMKATLLDVGQRTH